MQYVATTTRTYQGKVYATHLLRCSYRGGGKVKHETLGNLSRWPPDLIETIRKRMRGEEGPSGDDFEIVRSLRQGHIAAVLGTLDNIGLNAISASRPCVEQTLVLAMIVV